MSHSLRVVAATEQTLRLTSYAHGGGCACKIPPGQLESMVAGLVGGSPPRGSRGDLLVGLDGGDDAAVVRIERGRAVVATAAFVAPVVEDASDWGRISAANALSDVYAMGGEPLVAVNLLCWPRGVLPEELACEALGDGFVSGGTRRNLDWVRPHLTSVVAEDELLLLADPQTSGGLLVAGEIPGAPIVGELVPRGDAGLVVR
jgi:selenophosphate synthase